VHVARAPPEAAPVPNTLQAWRARIADRAVELQARLAALDALEKIRTREKEQVLDLHAERGDSAIAGAEQSTDGLLREEVKAESASTGEGKVRMTGTSC
jgi:hypothetical protein